MNFPFWNIGFILSNFYIAFNGSCFLEKNKTTDDGDIKDDILVTLLVKNLTKPDLVNSMCPISQQRIIFRQ